MGMSAQQIVDQITLEVSSVPEEQRATAILQCVGTYGSLVREEQPDMEDERILLAQACLTKAVIARLGQIQAGGARCGSA